LYTLSYKVFDTFSSYRSGLLNPPPVQAHAQAHEQTK
jgi:hypothetical protein